MLKRGREGAPSIPHQGSEDPPPLSLPLATLPSLPILADAEEAAASIVQSGAPGSAAALALRPRSQRRAAVVSRAAPVPAAAPPAVPSPILRASGADESDGDEPDGVADGAEKKLRFVWTNEMHTRFESAVHQLGVAHAKPQAIRQLMDCEGEELAPTRQNIKSHLQKYRLLLQKQAGHCGQSGYGGQASYGFEQSHELSRLPLAGRGLSPSLATEVDHQNQLLLLQQLDLHAKLHEQLLVQQRTQVELSMKLSCKPHAVLVPDQIMRLAQHVMLQRQLLQHLVAMLHVYLDEPVSRSSAQEASSLLVSEVSTGTYGGAHGEVHDQSSLLPQTLLPSMQSFAFGGVDSSSFIQVDEVPSQQEVMNGFGEMQGEPC